MGGGGVCEPIPSTKMASTRRFQNPYPDYSGSLVPSCTREALLPVVAELVDRVVSHTSGAGGRGSGGGVYVGPAGAAYMLVRALDAGLEAPRDVSYLETAWRLGEAGLRGVERDPESRASFLLGGAGVYVVLAMVSLRMGQRERALEFASQYAALYEVCVQPRFLPCGSDELFVGRAGFLHGADYLSRELGVPVLTRDQIACLCSVMVTSGEEYARSTHSASPLMYAYYGTEYLGAAHGLCAVLLALLCHVEVLDGRQAALVWGAVDFLLQLQGPEGAAPGADNWAPPWGRGGPRVDAEELVHWCHGAPGVAHLFVRAFASSREPRFLRACERAGELVWRKGLLKKGPGVCHGVAGNAYLFLLLHRLTGEQKHLYRAQRFAEFLWTPEFASGARTPDAPHSLYEGLAGTACFLLDLLNPASAHFPLFDALL
ncbi:LOW QUALITY PROTEIN: lanC-like protein 3 [Lampetra planeri]